MICIVWSNALCAQLMVCIVWSNALCAQVDDMYYMSCMTQAQCAQVDDMYNILCDPMRCVHKLMICIICIV